MAELNFEEFNNIPTVEIEQDIKDTEFEIDQFQAEIDALSKHRERNRVEIYFKEGGVIQMKELISKLKSIIAYRKTVFK